MNREFPLGAALTVALSALGPPGSSIGPWCDLRDFYELLAWLVGDIPTVEQIPGHTARARTTLLAQYPGLAAAADPPTSDAPDTEVLAWLSGQAQQHGAFLDISRGDPK